MVCSTKQHYFYWNSEPQTKKKWTLSWTELLFRRNVMLSYFIWKPPMVGGRQLFPSPGMSEVSFGLRWRQKVEYLPKTFANFALLSQLFEMDDCTEVGFCTVLMLWVVGVGWILKKEPASHKNPIDKMLINDLCIKLLLVFWGILTAPKLLHGKDLWYLFDFNDPLRERAL